jgi:replicative DNA helicase
LLTDQIGGLTMGDIVLVGGLSGTGKSSLIRNLVLPKILEEDEKIVYMINEEGVKKAQKEMLVWIANNILKEDMQKHVLRNGKFTEQAFGILKRSAKWLEEKKNQIILVPFKSYTKSKAIKVIKKYCSMGVNYFVLDTFKPGKDCDIKNVIQQMKTDMIDLYDVIKPETRNVSLICTAQLSKSSAKQRYYDQGNTGESKSIIDVVSKAVFVRNIFNDERHGEKHELKVYNLVGKKSKVEVKLDDDKNYQILFTVKNRDGASGGNSAEIVVEHDLSRNVYKEVGLTHVIQDF